MVIEPDAPLAKQIKVELVDVPEQASVTVDGEPAQGARLHFVHGSGEHEIVVSSPGYAPFRVRHDAAADGRYVVALSPVVEPPQQVKSARPRRAERRASPAARRQNGLVRTPDF
jgi:hypothetical protein